MSTIRVVLVDDDKEFLESTKAVLELYGDIDVRTADSAEKGIELLKTFHPDVALIDIVMHGKWGDDVAAAIKHDSDLKDIAFAFFTGSKKLVTRTEVEDAGSIIGGNTFLIKGMEPDKLREKIFELADQQNKKIT